MFTGIISALGRVQAIEPIGGGADMRLTIAHPADFVAPARGGPNETGATIASSGVCQTAIGFAPGAFVVEVSAETLARTTLGRWREGTGVNLERPLRMGDELGGHIVSGHVDGLGTVAAVTPENGSHRVTIGVPGALARFIAEKGSVAVDGVSLTVNETGRTSFGVNVIAHTSAVTGFGALRPGDAVNIEVDMLARYVARLGEFR